MKFKIAYYLSLLFILTAVLCFLFNRDVIYEQLGNYYYKKNNIEKAQIFYEYSFSFGNKNLSAKENYLNSIINSPLDIESQKKLVKLAEAENRDVVSGKAKQFLYDLKREIHKKYPSNYIKQAVYNHQIVRWNKFPITYSYKNSANIPDFYIEEINKAFSEWEKLGVVLFSEIAENGDINIDFVNNQNQTSEPGKKYVIAYTSPQISSTSLQKMNIRFNLNSPDGALYSPNQIYNTALHEIFHAMGFMGHSFDKDNVMYLSKNNNDLVNDVRLKLTEADMNTFKLLYKIEPDITNSKGLESEFIPYLVLGDEEEINFSKTKEAKHYINYAPSLPSGYIDLAESLVAEKKYSEAVKKLERALNLANDDEMQYIIYYDLAVAYYYITNYEMADYYLEKAFEIKNGEDLHFLKAEILSKTNIPEAKKEFRYLINTAPHNPEYVIRLADIYIKERDYLNARRLLKTFLKQNPEFRKDKQFSSYGILIF